jgi:hypothetical protein
MEDAKIFNAMFDKVDKKKDGKVHHITSPTPHCDRHNIDMF